MVLVINIIAAIILFCIPIRAYQNKNNLIFKHPFDEESLMGIDYSLYFLVFSVLTAMIFLGPLSYVKYAYWIVFLLILMICGVIKVKGGGIVGTYLLFLGWALG